MERPVALAKAVRTMPDINNTLEIGTRSTASGSAPTRKLPKTSGIFTRLGWNDGKTQDFAFTAIDRLASAGVSITGAPWRRPADTLAGSFAAAGISGAHAVYLARGGLDFIIGDGRLNYAPEYLWESYYSAQVVKGFFVSFDAQITRTPHTITIEGRFGPFRSGCILKEPRSNEDGGGDNEAPGLRKRTPFSSWTVLRYRMLALFAVIGPGFITANVDNDPGGILTYSNAGAKYGYTLLWTLVPPPSR